MTHLKHSGPIRQAAHAKRTALVEILNADTASNDGDLFQAADLEAIDAAFAARKDADCADFGRRTADRATAAEVARDPKGGYLA